jgi:hypothetical protein
MESKPLHHNKNQQGFTVPENYFEQSKTQLLTKINNGGFTVPEGYFELTQAKLLAQVKPKAKLNLVWVKYAAAASVLLVVSLFLLKPTYAPNKALTDDDIINYVANDNLNDIPATALVNNTTTDDTDTELMMHLDEETILTEL